LGHEGAIWGWVVETGTAGTATLVAERSAAGADGAAGLGSAAASRGADRPASGQERGRDSEVGVADQPAFSARRSGAGLVRAASAGESGVVGCAASAAHRGAGLWSAAGRPRPLDGAPADRRGGETQTGAARGAGDDPGPAGKPPPEAVAGKKSGERRGRRKSTSPAWGTYWVGNKKRDGAGTTRCVLI